ncbi:MAG TPA: hypothetical protein DCZ75_07350 [Geobacter sp.]|nr:hypothetical protein [Geobacter sp.]
MRSMRRGIAALTMAMGVLVAATVSDASGETGEVAPGTYRCSSYNVSGAGGSCRNMQSLVLNADGSYRYSSTHGRWSVRDSSLVLSKSGFWGPGMIIGNTIRFEYDYRGLHHAVTWGCQECDSAATKGTGKGTGATTPAGAYVGVSLSLEFDTAVGGVTAFTIVPAEAAASYSHNAPLPEGAVQGLARETGRTTVALATNRNNNLRSGKLYVVFLGWPRETVAVALLDLPPVTGDYAATLRATLDGAAVLGRVGK